MLGHEKSYEQERYDELACYTLCLGDAAFLHQNVVDAQTAQWAEPGDKPIAALFALVGLYLSLEWGYTGREVQEAHVTLAKHRTDWPRFPLPALRGSMWASDVLARPPGPARNLAIGAWCKSVWAAYSANHPMIDALVRTSLNHAADGRRSQ